MMEKLLIKYKAFIKEYLSTHSSCTLEELSLAISEEHGGCFRVIINKAIEELHDTGAISSSVRIAYSLNDSAIEE